MAHFDVYRNCNDKANDVPYLLDVQSDILDELEAELLCLYGGAIASRQFRYHPT